MSEEKRPPGDTVIPVLYVHFVRKVALIARRKGYAIALHGSMSRDLDLVAVPWTEQACTPLELAAAVAAGATDHHAPLGKPERKPHGRLAWQILVGGPLYIDLSVVPPRRRR